jgi:hypothetical protein
MTKTLLIAVVSFVFLTSLLLFAPRDRVSAFGVSRCARLSAEEKKESYAVEYDDRALTELHAGIAEMHSTDSSLIDQKLEGALDALARERAFVASRFARASSADQVFYKKREKVMEEQVAFWRARQTDVLSGGIVKSNEGEAFAAYINGLERGFQSDLNFRKNEVAMLGRELHSCAAARARTVAKFVRWAGTYAEGADAITVSGGTAGLEFKESRQTEEENWHRGGGCQVQGSEASCKWEAHFHDAQKDVEYSGHGTLTLYTDSISYKFVQDTGTITYSDGHSCPNINECTGLHPGAESDGTWTRKR